MTANDRTSTPSLLVAVDTETRPEPSAALAGYSEQRLWIGCAVCWRREGGRRTRERAVEFTDAETFWAWLDGVTQPRKRCYVWAHNAGFDVTALRLWEHLESGRYRPYRRPGRDGSPGTAGGRYAHGLILEDPPTVLDLVDERGQRFTVLDSMNWLPMGLQKIGQLIGCEKAPTPGDEATDEDWRVYCRQDVEVLRAAVDGCIDWIAANDAGNFRYTSAGQSMALYRHRCRDERILLGHEPELKALERAALYGARARSYFVGRVVPEGSAFMLGQNGAGPGTAVLEAGAVFRLDVNSAYPAAMTAGPYPIQYQYSCRGPTPRGLLGQLGCQEGVAQVIVDSRTEPYPVRLDGKTRWCVGRFITTLAGPELKRALRSDHVASVVQAQLYRQGEPFGTFAEACIAGRRAAGRAGDALGEYLWKTVGVSLWGKFCQRTAPWTIDHVEIPPHPWGTYTRQDLGRGTIEKCRAIGWTAQIAGAPAETESNFPLLGAYVVAYHRERMRGWRLTAGEGETLYEDADSLHVTAEGFRRLMKAGEIDLVEPGKLRPVEVALSAEYRGPKHYRLGGAWTVAGVGKKAKQDAKGMFHETRFYGLTVALGGQPPLGPLTKDVEYPPPCPTIDGRLSPSGWLDWPVNVC